MTSHEGLLLFAESERIEYSHVPEEIETHGVKSQLPGIHMCAKALTFFLIYSQKKSNTNTASAIMFLSFNYS
jgi:hypothetical protein